MGNKVTQSAFVGIFQEFEHMSGKRLIQAVKDNDAEQVRASIEAAKKEFSKPVASNTNKAEYSDMVDGMLAYLTRGYDVGDGPLFKQTPLQYARLLKSTEAESVIEASIAELEGVVAASAVRVSPTVGEVTHDRAALAKSRLQEFRASKGKPK